MAFEKRYTARQVAEAVIETTKKLLGTTELAKAEKMRKDGQTLGAAIGFPGAAPTAPTPSPTPVGKAEMDKCGTFSKVHEKAKREGYSEESADKIAGKAKAMEKAEMEAMKLRLIKSGMSPNDVQAQLTKYETEMSSKLGYKPSELGAKEVDQEKTDKDYKVHPDAPNNALGPKSPASNTGEPEVQKSETDRLREQANPMKNPKEQAEGNNELAGTTSTQVGQDGKNVPGFDEMRGHLKLAKFIGHMEAMRKVRKGASNG